MPRIIAESRLPVCDSNHKFNRASQNGTPLPPVCQNTLWAISVCEASVRCLRWKIVIKTDRTTKAGRMAWTAFRKTPNRSGVAGSRARASPRPTRFP